MNYLISRSPANDLQDTSLTQRVSLKKKNLEAIPNLWKEAKVDSQIQKPLHK